MGFAAKAMKQAHNNMDIDQVEDLMDEVKEQQQIAEEISNAISHPVGFDATGVDDDDLLKELEDIEQEELDKVLLETGPSPSKTLVDLPEVPAAALSSPERTAASASRSKASKEEEDELAELAKWAN